MLGSELGAELGCNDKLGGKVGGLLSLGDGVVGIELGSELGCSEPNGLGRIVGTGLGELRVEGERVSGRDDVGD